jgi:hypothetical protein
MAQQNGLNILVDDMTDSGEFHPNESALGVILLNVVAPKQRMEDEKSKKRDEQTQREKLEGQGVSIRETATPSMKKTV